MNAPWPPPRQEAPTRGFWIGLINYTIFVVAVAFLIWLIWWW